jgi:protein-tyrosine-phosphatase/DNA-binding transcriptional ArsR family regulator
MTHQTGLMYCVTVVSSRQDALPPAFVRLAAHPVRWKLLTALGNSDFRVRELVSRVNEPQNLVSYHLRLLRDEGLVTATRSSFDGRDSYYHLDLARCADALAETGKALHEALRVDGGASTDNASGRPGRRAAVLFVCTGNSIRSPMAEALLRRYAADRVAVNSAGTRPGPHLHPEMVRVMGDQYGIDTAGRLPRDISTVARRRFDHVVTLCDRAREAGPDFPHHPRRAHWSIPDPAAGGGEKAVYAAVQRTAADIETRIRHQRPWLTSIR